MSAHFINEVSLNESVPVNTTIHISKHCSIYVELKKINQDQTNYGNVVFNTTQIKPLTISINGFEDEVIKNNSIESVYSNNNIFKKYQTLIFTTSSKYFFDSCFSGKYIQIII
jgi:hypothetical protein